MRHRSRRNVRQGFLMGEVAIGLGILAVAVVLLAQVSIWCLSERQSLASRQDALQSAANVLELARATSWDQLTPEWAAGQQLPEMLGQRLARGKLHVRVESEASRPQVKRVTVEITWDMDKDRPAAPVKLVGLFAARSAPVAGGKL